MCSLRSCRICLHKFRNAVISDSSTQTTSSKVSRHATVTQMRCTHGLHAKYPYLVYLMLKNRTVLQSLHVRTRSSCNNGVQKHQKGMQISAADLLLHPAAALTLLLQHHQLGPTHPRLVIERTTLGPGLSGRDKTVRVISNWLHSRFIPGYA